MLKPAMIFTSKMVLQRCKPIPVWGDADPGAEVTVALDGQKATATADCTGCWKAELPAREAATGCTMTIASGDEEFVCSDVCIGEVWLAGGQSNMEYLLGFEAHYDELLTQPEDTLLRFFDYPEVSYEGQLADYHYCHEGFWRSGTREELAYFSAVGFYFARELRRSQDVPVGIVGCNWGGTPACAWMDPAYLTGTEAEVILQDYARSVEGLDEEQYQKAFRANPGNDRTNMLGDPFAVIGVKNTIPRQEQLKIMASMPQGPEPVGPWYERRPGGLYETMLKKVHPYGIRGAIWYQGETNADYHPETYTTTFSRMIRCWRDLWQEEFPFLFVQLAPFDKWLGCTGENYPIIRACQAETAKTVPGTWMASIGDVGMQWDIHPKNKLPVGQRLALLARNHVYGEPVPCEAPALLDAMKKDGEITLRFAHGDGLTIRGDALRAMVGVTESGKCRELTHAEIRENTLILPHCQEIRQLKYAWTGYYEINLFNAAGIPALPFEVTV